MSKELPRNTVAIHLKGEDHVVTGAEVTRCGLDVPYGYEWLTELKKPCSICFPDSTDGGKVAGGKVAGGKVA